MSGGFRILLAPGATCLLVVLVGACNKNPASPTAPTFLAVTLAAPPEIAPGESVQLVATAQRSDGSAENVSDRAQWTVQSFPIESTVVSVTPAGFATGMERGRALVTARFNGLTAEATLLVLPRGTVRLAGKIAANGSALDRATISVISGVGQGLVAFSDRSGDFELFGVAGLVHVRASKEGYVDRIQSVEASAAVPVAIELNADRPQQNYSGVYTLIIGAARCIRDFPQEAKQRIYTARLDQKGADVRITLSDANFWPQGNSFSGLIENDGLFRFSIRPLFIWDYDANDLMEYVGNDSLIVGGPVVARYTSGAIRGGSEPSGDGAFMRMNMGRGVCDLDRFELVPR